MRPFCFAEDGKEHPTGPYSLPESFAVTVIGRTGDFTIRDHKWTVTLLKMTTLHGIGLVELDDRCVPRA